MRKLYTLIALVALMMVATASAHGGGGPHNKATGDVVWTSAPGVEGIHTVFDAHADAPGRQPERGTVTQDHPDGGTRVVDVDCAQVDGNEAWFAGEVTSADGVYSGQVGERRLYWVQDNGTPGTAGPDGIGNLPVDGCERLGEWRGGGTVTAGNLNVFFSGE